MLSWLSKNLSMLSWFSETGVCLVTHAGILASVGRSVASVCRPVCPRSKRKMAWAINTKLGTRILHSSRSACIDLEVKRSRPDGYVNRHGRVKVQQSRRVRGKGGSTMDTAILNTQAAAAHGRSSSRH